jgi:hypothetical protein
MDRKRFLCSTLQLGLGACALTSFGGHGGLADAAEAPEDLARVKADRDFTSNWLADLLDTMETDLDEKTRVRLIEGCGRGCFRRYQFQQDIAQQGRGDVDKLVVAYKKNFEIWREGERLVHVRYGETSPACYCPAAKNRPPKPRDLHCECTRMMHQTIFETALGRQIKVDILESLRRGGRTCHFLVHLA